MLLPANASELSFKPVGAVIDLAPVTDARLVELSVSEPEDEIIDALHRFQCDRVVMATRGKMGVVDTLFNESTTQEPIKNFPVPVLVFP